ncbi:MAG: TolC family protein [Candidatus Omnitrophota bacterium]|nr:TolC family protein [Candidatus Omnitrophota bacterium]
MKQFKIFLSIIIFLTAFIPGAVSAEEILNWQDCVKEAAKNHPDLISAREVVIESKASKDIAQSPLAPQITSQAGTTLSKIQTSVKGSKTSTTNSYSVTGTQLIFDGFKTIDNTMAAKENIKSSQFAYKFTSSQVRFRLRSAYVSLLRSQEFIKITQDIYDIRKKNLDLIKLRYDSGIEHKGALLTAEANLAQAEYGIKQAKRDMEVAQSQLIKEMGRSIYTSMFVQGDFIVKEPVNTKPDFVALSEINPSYLELDAATRAADYNIRSAIANFFPTISAQGTVGRQDSRWLPQTNQWNMGFSVSWPLFEGGLRIAQVGLAKAQFNQAQSTERSAKDSIIVTLEETWQTLLDSLDNVEVRRKFLVADEERSKIADAQYSIGFLIFDNWTIIQDNLVSSKRDFLDAQAAAMLAEANWIQAKGETLEYEE